jgi:hypothetical protein
MATKKLINLNTNGTQVEYSGVLTSAGASSSGEIPALDAVGRLDVSMMPVGFGSDAITATAGEALTAGDMVYISGTGTILKADATTIAKQARGYIITSVANAASATVYFDDTNTALTGLTPGATYFLSNTPGGVTTTPTTTTGQICQEVGFAASATTLRVNIQEPVIRV